MSFNKLKSWAKINLSLHIIKRLPNNYHKIESLITFAQLSDEIKIKKINKKKTQNFFFRKVFKRNKQKKYSC